MELTPTATGYCSWGKMGPTWRLVVWITTRDAYAHLGQPERRDGMGVHRFAQWRVDGDWGPPQPVKGPALSK